MPPADVRLVRIFTQMALDDEEGDLDAETLASALEAAAVPASAIASLGVVLAALDAGRLSCPEFVHVVKAARKAGFETNPETSGSGESIGTVFRRFDAEKESCFSFFVLKSEKVPQ